MNTYGMPADRLRMLFLFSEDNIIGNKVDRIFSGTICVSSCVIKQPHRALNPPDVFSIAPRCFNEFST